MVPGYFVKGILANEIAPLIGIGYGPSQLSFLGILPIGSTVFTILMISTFTLCIFIYIFNYERAKYALFAFPIIIFLFNNRVFAQYFYYWIFISLLPAIDIISRPTVKEESSVRTTKKILNKVPYKKVAVAFIALLISASGIAIFHEVSLSQQDRIIIQDVKAKGYNSSGFVNSMMVELTYAGNNLSSAPLNFRIIEAGPVSNGNGLLWVNNLNEISNSNSH